jgi:hypothetical protein
MYLSKVWFGLAEISNSHDDDLLQHLLENHLFSVAITEAKSGENKTSAIKVIGNLLSINEEFTEYLNQVIK